MKKILSVVFFALLTVSAYCEAIDYDNCVWFNQKYFNKMQGVCLTPNWGTNDEESSWIRYLDDGDDKYVILAGGSEFTLDAGFINIEHVVILADKDASLLTPVTANIGGELAVTNEKVYDVDYTLFTWTNPGQSICSLTLTVGEKATLSTTPDKKGELRILWVAVDLGAAEKGQCGVAPPKDTVTLDNPAIIFKDNSNYYWDDYEYEVELKDSKAGVNIHFEFEPDDKDEFEKTYSLGGSSDYVEKDGEKSKLNYGVLTIKKNTEDNQKYDFNLDIIAKNGTRYFWKWTGPIVAASAAFEKEPMTATTITFEPTRAEYDDYWISDGELDVYLYKGTDPFDYMELYFVTKTKVEGTIITPGTYAINDSEDLETVLASGGIMTEGSYFAPQAYWEEDYLETTTEYYFKSGTVKVEASAKGVKLTVNAKTHYGSTIQAVYEGELKDETATGIESQKSKVESRKLLRNGQLIIIRNGVRYNAYGGLVD